MCVLASACVPAGCVCYFVSFAVLRPLLDCADKLSLYQYKFINKHLTLQYNELNEIYFVIISKNRKSILHYNEILIKLSYFVLFENKRTMFLYLLRLTALLFYNT